MILNLLFEFCSSFVLSLDNISTLFQTPDIFYFLSIGIFCYGHGGSADMKRKNAGGNRRDG